MEIKRYGAKEFLAAGKLCIRENEIHIWCICWPEMTDFWVNHEYILSGQESEQVGRFRFSEDRMRYIAGKVVVRLLLKRYLDVETIDFSVSERGKPYHKKIAGKNNRRHCRCVSIHLCKISLDLHAGICRILHILMELLLDPV